VPLTRFQQEVLAALADPSRGDRYLAGGAALHFQPQSTRYSDDLGFFADTEPLVAAAFARDKSALEQAGFVVTVEFVLPGFVRSVVRREDAATRVDWARESAWRFLPLVQDPLGGWLLHPVDLALNKVLALAGRDEPRDFVDALFVHTTVLPLSALVWASVGKDPGLSPLSVLELLRRHGRYRPEDFARLQLTEPFDLPEARRLWTHAIEDADRFVRERSPDELGCLYYSMRDERFVAPHAHASLDEQRVVPHFGRPGGVLPGIADRAIDP
jgi:hypothetical protein